MIKISPSLLSCDLLNIQQEIAKIENAGASSLHIDVMDGVLVPNIAFGPSFVLAMRNICKLPLHVHIMIMHPEKWLKTFFDKGASSIIFHQRAMQDSSKAALMKILNLAKQHQWALSLAIESADELDVEILKLLHSVLIMTVKPGFSGQSFLIERLEIISKAAALKKQYNLNYDITVDGGINAETAPQAIKCGAESLVSGNYIFSGDYRERIKSLQIY